MNKWTSGIVLWPAESCRASRRHLEPRPLAWLRETDRALPVAPNLSVSLVPCTGPCQSLSIFLLPILTFLCPWAFGVPIRTLFMAGHKRGARRRRSISWPVDQYPIIARLTPGAQIGSSSSVSRHELIPSSVHYLVRAVLWLERTQDTTRPLRRYSWHVFKRGVLEVDRRW